MTTPPTPSTTPEPPAPGAGLDKLSARDWADACEMWAVMINPDLPVDLVVHRVNALLHDVHMRDAHTAFTAALCYAAARIVPEIGERDTLAKFSYWATVLGAQAEDEEAEDSAGVTEGGA